ncbi:universal stress protein [Natrinema gari]|uniref:UspA domain-containing protein n=1 Tax=Natrinema gari JCM 14663 TaxID=1230459 RepID=L9ZCK7_9EURY|nr:universal stress protein [Natrinema gari]ELY82888.1 hypothetical protein C486_03394 [Natrinema gari JCM 14663]
MSNSSPDVPITAPAPSSESEVDAYGYDGEVIHQPDYSIVVPVIDDPLDSSAGINARRFLQTAIALAADNDGRVVLLGIAEVDDKATLKQIREYASLGGMAEGQEQSAPELVIERQSQLAQVVSIAGEINPNVPVRATVQTVTNTTQGILDALAGRSETAVLLLQGTGFDKSWLLGKNMIETVIEEANCDVFVENVGVQEGTDALYVPDIEDHTVASLSEPVAKTIDSILLPVGTGPHAALASEAARAVARASNASVTVLHVIPPDASSKKWNDAKGLLKFAEFVLGSDAESETELREATDPADVIIQEAKNHDFTSIGSPERKSGLWDLVFTPVQEALADRNDVTVLMSRDADRTMRSLYYRYKQAIGDEESDGNSE